MQPSAQSQARAVFAKLVALPRKLFQLLAKLTQTLSKFLAGLPPMSEVFSRATLLKLLQTLQSSASSLWSALSELGSLLRQGKLVEALKLLKSQLVALFAAIRAGVRPLIDAIKASPLLQYFPHVRLPASLARGPCVICCSLWGFFAQVGYVLSACAILVTDMLWLRTLMICANVCGLLVNLFWLKPVT